MAHMRQSTPHPGLDFLVKVPNILKGVPSSLGSGQGESGHFWRDKWTHVDRHKWANLAGRRISGLGFRNAGSRLMAT